MFGQKCGRKRLGKVVKRNVWGKVLQEKFGKSWEGKTWESLGKVVKPNFWGKVCEKKFGKSCERENWEKV